jgi:DNA-directed RNA polymerase subunit RPC12/RpoP
VREAGSVSRCAECGAESEELASGWRAYLAADFDEDEDKVLLFCPECARREFGPFDEGLTT